MLRACQRAKPKRGKVVDDDRRCLGDRSMSIDRRGRRDRRVAINAIKSTKSEDDVYIVLELDTLSESCSTHLSYLATAFTAEAYVIPY